MARPSKDIENVEIEGIKIIIHNKNVVILRGENSSHTLFSKMNNNIDKLKHFLNDNLPTNTNIDSIIDKLVS